jgi:hypothetical protein
MNFLNVTGVKDINAMTQKTIITRLQKINSEISNRCTNNVEWMVDSTIKEEYKAMNKKYNDYYVEYYYDLFQKYDDGYKDKKHLKSCTPKGQDSTMMLSEEDYMVRGEIEQRPSMHIFIKIVELNRFFLKPEVTTTLSTENGSTSNNNINNQMKYIVQLINMFPPHFMCNEERKLISLACHKFIDTLGNSWVKQPSTYDIFEASHMYFAIQSIVEDASTLSTTLTIEEIQFTEQPDTVPFKKSVENIVSIMKDKTQGLVMDMIELLIFNLVVFPCARECYIGSKIYKRDNVAEVCKIIINNRDLPASALERYQLRVYEFVHANIICIQRGQIEFLLDEKYPELHQIFYIVVLNEMLQQNCQLRDWVFKCVVLHEAWKRYRGEVVTFANRYPIFVQVQPYRFHILYKWKLFFHQDVLLTMHYYIQLCKGVKFSNHTNHSTTRDFVKLENLMPWLLVWKKNQKYYVDIDLMEKTLWTNLNELFQVPEVIVVQRETKESLLKKFKEF